jgi:hypothetical protein
MARFAKGSQEAKDKMEKMRAMRGGNKISRPNVERGEPQPAKVKGGKIPSPPSRSYNTAQEDMIDGIIMGTGSLRDCCVCNGMGIVKLKK